MVREKIDITDDIQDIINYLISAKNTKSTNLHDISFNLRKAEGKLHNLKKTVIKTIYKE